MQAVSLGRRDRRPELLVEVGEPSVSIQLWGRGWGTWRGIGK